MAGLLRCLEPRQLVCRPSGQLRLLVPRLWSEGCELVGLAVEGGAADGTGERLAQLLAPPPDLAAPPVEAVGVEEVAATGPHATRRPIARLEADGAELELGGLLVDGDQLGDGDRQVGPRRRRLAGRAERTAEAAHAHCCNEMVSISETVSTHAFAFLEHRFAHIGREILETWVDPSVMFRAQLFDLREPAKDKAGA